MLSRPATTLESLPSGGDVCVAPGPERKRERLLDLLVESMLDTPGLKRAGGRYDSAKPWAVADYGRFVLARGWWVFECEGDAGIEDVEVRLSSEEDTLLLFSPLRNPLGKVSFHSDRTFDVSVLVSAWPGLLSVTVLRLRRLNAAEIAKLFLQMLVRLARSGRPFGKLLHFAAHLFGGRPIRIHTKRQPMAGQPPPHLEAVSPVHREALHPVTVVLREGETFDPRAIEIVTNAFARAPELETLYADLVKDGRICPRPQWDADLAINAAYAPSPIFFRGERNVGDAWLALRELSTQPGAVSRIALPLAASARVSKIEFTIPPVPELSRTPTVSVVIPTKLRIDLLDRCLTKLADQTGYPGLDVVIVNNGAEDPRFPDVIAAASSRTKLRVVEDFGSFNFSRLINTGVRASAGEIILMLNDDVEAIQPGWLHRMVESAMNPSVGCVGARLLHPDGTIQHAGVTLGISGVCGHLWKGLDREAAAAIPQVVLPSRRIAVTGACLALRRDIFNRVGGLDEASFPVAYNDIDLCLRVGAPGLTTVYRGDAALIHHESQSRRSDSETAEKRKRIAGETNRFVLRWGRLLRNDPFASPAFDLTTESGAIHPTLLRGAGPQRSQA